MSNDDPNFGNWRFDQSSKFEESDDTRPETLHLDLPSTSRDDDGICRPWRVVSPARPEASDDDDVPKPSPIALLPTSVKFIGPDDPEAFQSPATIAAFESDALDPVPTDLSPTTSVESDTDPEALQIDISPTVVASVDNDDPGLLPIDPLPTSVASVEPDIPDHSPTHGAPHTFMKFDDNPEALQIDTSPTSVTSVDNDVPELSPIDPTSVASVDHDDLPPTAETSMGYQNDAEIIFKCPFCRIETPSKVALKVHCESCSLDFSSGESADLDIVTSKCFNNDPIPGPSDEQILAVQNSFRAIQLQQPDDSEDSENEDNISACTVDSQETEFVFVPQARTKDKLLKCADCSFRAKRKSSIIDHRKVCTYVGLKRCKFCRFKTYNSEVFESHLKRHESNHLEFRCSKCKEPTGEQWFHCDLCTYQAPAYGCLNNHFDLRHFCYGDDIHRFVCQVCGFHTKNYLMLVYHCYRFLDTGSNNLGVTRCEVCDKEFISYSSYFKHFITHKRKTVKKHTPLTEYKCLECAYTTKRYRLLKDHIQNFHVFPRDSSYYRCDFCNFKTKVLKILHEHVQKFCDYQASIEKVLQTSVRRYKRAREFLSCDLCDYTTTDTESLRHHMMDKHGTNREPSKRRKQHF